MEESVRGKSRRRKKRPVKAKSVWKVDPRSGKRYKTIPRTEMDEDNRPKEQLEDFDEGDLDGEALKYLGHLR